MAGGAGNDTYLVDSPLDSVVESAGAGYDIVRSTVTRSLEANVERLMLTGAAATNGTGNDLDNWLSGNAAANRLDGGDLADAMWGFGGDDTLLGGLGNDHLRGDTATTRSTEARRIHVPRGAGRGECRHRRWFRPAFRQAQARRRGASRHRRARRSRRRQLLLRSGRDRGADPAHRVVYDTADGELYYDADGDGAGAALLVASLQGAPALNATDIS